MDAPPVSLLEAAFIALVGLVSGLLAANYIWRDVRYRRAPVPSFSQRLGETIFAAKVFGLAMGAAAWALVLVINLARVNPSIIPFVLLGLYLLMGLNVAWDHFRRYRGFLSALLVGILWLPLMVLLRRV